MFKLSKLRRLNEQAERHALMGDWDAFDSTVREFHRLAAPGWFERHQTATLVIIGLLLLAVGTLERAWS